MSGLRQTFSSLLFELLGNRLNMVDDATGALSATLGKQIRALGLLNNAMRTIWEKPRGKGWVWPWTVQSKTVTLTAGAISLTDLDYPIFFSVWNTNPDAVDATAWNIPARWGVDGIVPSDQSLGSYFVFYIPRAPEYTLTAVAGATTYQPEDLVLGADGECYRALTSALGSEISDTAKWAVQPVYKHFQSAVVHQSQAAWFYGLNNFEAAALMDREGEIDMADLWTGISKQQRNFTPPHYLNTGSWA